MKHLQKHTKVESACGHKGELTSDWREARHCGSCVNTDAFKMARQIWDDDRNSLLEAMDKINKITGN